ncbi:MAG: Fe-S cluster assembly ATPase SufC [Magnetococcales bacterium]|nr:Fe-S cluster assembly ATPase SufC [Magnetococcales bacterium]
MLEISDLHVSIGEKSILRGLDFQLGEGEVHALMGPNGAGKSTLANLLAGRADCRVSQGEISYRGRDLLALSPEERSREGLFLAFQNPVEIPGVSNARLLKEAYNAHLRHRGLGEIDAMVFRDHLRRRLSPLGLGEEWLLRPVNAGFSGGEKKRNELLQMLVLEPRLAILDEIDSGMDIDALGKVAEAITLLRENRCAVLLITHYPRLLEQVAPDRVHVLLGGRIGLSGGRQLAGQLEERGYGWIEEAVA